MTSAYERGARAVQGGAAPTRDLRPAALSDVLSPALQISRLYPLQSYFDDVLQARALETQDPANPIVVPVDDPNKGEVQLNGYAVGLHPDSQTPVAIEFKLGGARGGQASSSTVMVLKPGQIVRPYGTPEGLAVSGKFSGFKVGLPFGWLGGGLATLVVFQTPSTEVQWDAHPEIIFHRQRLPVRQPADLAVGTLADAPFNWPMRFPWPHAQRGATSVPQRGSAVLAIAEPTRSLLVLRGVDSLASDSNFRLVFQSTNDAGGGVPIFEEWTWRAFSALGTSGNLTPQNPFLILSGGVGRLAADNGGLVIVDASGTGALAGAFIDITRYGRL